MKITDVRILSKVRVNTGVLVHQKATVVGIVLVGLTSPVLARFCDAAQSFAERATENITVLASDGRAYHNIQAKDIEPVQT